MDEIIDINNVHFIGTSHISKESIKEINDYVIANSPEIIAVELDLERLKALLEDKPSEIKINNFKLIKKLGFSTFIFILIASYAQKKFGSIVNTKPGSDMLAAVKIAQKNKLKLALIDQNINKTFAKLSRSITFKEKMNFLADIFKGIFSGKKQMKKLGLENLDLTKVPADELITKLIANTKTRYPTIYRVLIAERNKVMVNRIFKTMIKNPTSKILVVIGAGHKFEMIELLKLKIDKLVENKIEVM